MILPKTIKNKTFAVYGLGVTGCSVVNFLNNSGVKKIYLWDDNTKKREKFNKKIKLKDYLYSLNLVDFIIISPGININKSALQKVLKKNKHKIITDLDLFYIMHPNTPSIVVTGTNGKSTTCKIIEHLLKKNRFDVKLGGNIGKPILNLKIKKKTILIIEASSFQLAYSKFVKPKYALLLNISKDHLDWHKNMINYLQSKLKIFKLQNKNDYALISDFNLIKKFKGSKNSSKLKTVNMRSNIKIKNTYLNSKANQENIKFVYEISKILKIKKNSFINACNSFRGLPHRHELFLEKKNIRFINDSKATSFEASKNALQSNKNIFWIVGGLPKLKDKFDLKSIKKNIIKSFIIGKNIDFFKKELKDKIKYKITNNLKNSMKAIFTDLKKNNIINATILLSPASASYDQYKNFVERGDAFKKISKYYANKYL